MSLKSKKKNLVCQYLSCCWSSRGNWLIIKLNPEKESFDVVTESFLNVNTDPDLVFTVETGNIKKLLLVQSC